jgi:hypothetical protein
MAKIALGLIILMLAISSCTNTAKIDKELIYSTLNNIILQDTVFAPVVCSNFDQASIPADIQDEYFTSDKDFILEQIKSSNSITVDSGRLYFYWRKKKALEKSLIDTTCSQGIFYRLAYPIFSKDLQTVVIGITQDCNCMLGGWGFKAVYKRQNGKWKLIKKFDRWIS